MWATRRRKGPRPGVCFSGFANLKLIVIGANDLRSNYRVSKQSFGPGNVIQQLCDIDLDLHGCQWID